jgi:nucleoside-diphosphate-sugar epimerase
VVAPLDRELDVRMTPRSGARTIERSRQSNEGTGMPLNIVLVTGATGHAARSMAGRFQDEGCEVRALVRDASGAALVKEKGWTPVLGDLTDGDSLDDAVAGANVVVHAGAYLGDDWAQARRVNVDGTRLLARSAVASHVRRFVHISTMSVHGEPQPDGLSEDSPLAVDDTQYAYVATKAQAELALHDNELEGLEVVILRPGAICSEVHSQWGDELVGKLRLNGWPQDCHPDDILPWVHTENLADMTWLAATHYAAPGHVFFAVDRNVALREYFAPLTEAVGRQVEPANREPHASRSHLGKISTVLGYEARRDFEDTMRQLLDLAWNGNR